MEEKPSNLSQTDAALPSSGEQREKQKNPFKAATIICAILALAGLGFGVYEMTEANKAKFQPSNNTTANTDSEVSSELAELKKKYSILRDYVEKLEASGTEVPDDAKSATEASPSSNATSTGKYIYVNDWGIKVKLPEELTLVTYSYDYSDDIPVEKAGEGASLCISGSEDYSLYAFSTVRKSSLGLVCITRVSKQIEHLVDTAEIFHDDSGWYYISGIQAYMTEENTNARNYEKSILLLFKRHFADPSNYSPF